MYSYLRTIVFACAAASAVAQADTSELDRHIEAAQQAQQNQDCATAAREYAAAVRLMPSSGELRTNWGIALYCNNQPGDAIPVLEKALALQPRLAVPHLFLGLAALRLSNKSNAVKELETAVHMMPTDITSHVWLGYAYLATHDKSHAVAAFESALKLQPANVDALYALGEANLEVGRAKASELEKIAPHGRGIKLLLAEQHAMRSAEAVKPGFDIPPQWQSPREEKLFQQAMDAETRARSSLQRVLDDAPESDRAHQIQGDAYSVQQNNAAAIEEYAQVLRINPTLPGVRLALANCLMQVTRFDDALAALAEEQKIQPRSSEVWAATGRVELALGKNEEALISLQRANKLPDPPSVARLLLGETLLGLGKPESAVVELQQAINEGSDPARTNYLLARAYRATGNRTSMAQALDAYRQFSQDERERQAAAAFMRDPKSVRAEMTTQEVQDAAGMSVHHN